MPAGSDAATEDLSASNSTPWFSHKKLFFLNGGIGREKGAMPEQLDIIVLVRQKCLF